MKTHTTKLEKRIEQLVNKLQDKDQQHLSEMENTRLQLNKQERLTELYTNNCEEYQSKIKGLTTAIEEMQTMLKTAEESNQSLEQHCESEQNKNQSIIKELETKIGTLQNELDNANDLLLTSKKSSSADSSFDLSQLSTTAVAVGGMMKSGMTITQMYSAYVEATEALALEKDKNRLQTQYLDQILKEIEEKAPLLQQQRADYENALLNQDNMSNKLEKAMVQVEHYRIASEESQNGCRAAKRENERFRTQLRDLSQQVQVLLKEVEDARAGRVSQPTPLNSSRVSSSSQVISDQLVSFRSIAELQQQNSKLLCVVRELSEEQERRETEEEDPKVLDLRAKLEASADQMKELKMAQQRQVEMVDAVARQRDMYRVLLAQAGHNLGPVEEKKKVKEEMGNKHELALAELQKQFCAYKKEKQDQIALVQEQLDSMRNDYTAMLTEKTKLASKIDFDGEKYKILETSCNTLRSEATQYKTKSNELSSSVLKLQLTNDRLQNENVTSRDELSKLRQSLEGQRKTLELFRVNEIKLRTQNEALTRESRTQNMLLANLNTIHNNLERQEFERNERTDKKMQLLESELSEARRKLQSTELRYKTQEAIQNTQLRELKNTAEKSKSEAQERQKFVDKLQEQHNTLLAESAQVKTQLETLQYNMAQEKAAPSAGAERSSESDEVDDTIVAQAKRLKEQTAKITHLQHKIIEMTAREESLKSQVELAKQHAQQYKLQSEAHELVLKELSSSEQSVKSESERLISQNTEEIKTLSEKLRSATQDQERLQSELEEQQSRGQEQLRELSALLKKTQMQLEESRQKEETAISLEQDIRSQFNNVTDLFEESQSNLTEQRDECSELRGKVTDLQHKVEMYQKEAQDNDHAKNHTEKKLEEDSKVWATEKRSLESERATLTQRVEDLHQQNTLLHSQLQTLSKDVVELQKALSSESPSDNATEVSGNKTTEELWEIIRYVRREKDILSTKIDVTESEAIRYKNRCELLDKQLEETRSLLDEERTKSDNTLLSSEQHQDMLKKVEETQGLTEKVKLLGDEKAKLAQFNSLLKQKNDAYEKQIKPLKVINRELTDKVSILTTEKECLKKDVERWSTRTNELIEQCNKVDAKEFARLQNENIKLKVSMKKMKEDHSTEMGTLQTKQSTMEEESSRVSEEKRQLLSMVNSMKADGTKIKIELNNVSAELKTAEGQLSQQKADVEKLKKEQMDLAKENVEVKKELADHKTTYVEESEKKDDIIKKIRNLAKSYKAKFQEAETKLREKDEGTESRNQTEEKLQQEVETVKKRSMEAISTARTQIESLTSKNKELESKMEQGNSSIELLNAALQTEKEENEAKLAESSALVASLENTVQSTKEEIATLKQHLEEKDKDLARALERTRTSNAETNTDILAARSDQQTNTEDTPTASVKPTTIIGLSTPTAAVRPTSIAPDIPPRMAAVTPTTSVHISSGSSNTGTQVSSSSVQVHTEQARTSEPEVTQTGEVRATLRTPARSTARGDEVSSAGFKRSRCDDDGEQPGPSTKIAMVTSSAHVQPVEHVQTSEMSEVSQSTGPMLGIASSASQSSHIDSPDRSTNKSGQVSSTEHATRTVADNSASSSTLSTDKTTDAAVTSTETQLMSTEREAPSPESNEATPADQAYETALGDMEEEVMRDTPVASAEVSDVIDIPSDSEEEGGSTVSEGTNDEDVYSGLDEVEEDSRQLQFSFVQSSGGDPVLDALSEPDDQSSDAILSDSNNEATEATPSRISLRPGETPWAHLSAATSSSSTTPAISDTTSQAAASSSSNVRSIRRIKRQPPKKD